MPIDPELVYNECHYIAQAKSLIKWYKQPSIFPGLTTWVPLEKNLNSNDMKKIIWYVI